jgi:hypothetical protein
VGGDDRYMDDAMGGVGFDLDAVRRLEKYACHRTSDGRLFEFDQGRFWVSHIGPGDDERVPVAEPAALPDGPWWHSPVCGCTSCVPRSAEE